MRPDVKPTRKRTTRRAARRATTAALRRAVGLGVVAVGGLGLLPGCGDDEAAPEGSGTEGSGAAASVTSTSATGGGGEDSGATTTTTTSSTGAGGGATGGGRPTVFGGSRPATLSVPDDYDDATPAPLLVSLHGYTGSGALHEAYFQLRGPALDRGVLFVSPDGTTDSLTNQFWNANAACCDFFQTGVDDVGYLVGLIDEIRAAYAVDPKRIFFVGHSNGHFMGYEMACQRADLVAAVAGLAGGMLAQAAGCTPSEPVHHLHVHGDADTVVPYNGGVLGGGAATIASAEAALGFWAGQANCDAVATPGTAIDIVGALPGDETAVSTHENCDAGGSAELWRIGGGSHTPAFNATWGDRILDYLLAHPKP
ncbi:MAG: PHB depolymerase family esterase [Myxococcota bacterium]